MDVWHVRSALVLYRGVRWVISVVIEAKRTY